MDGSDDKKQLYDLSELQEYTSADGFKDQPSKHSSWTSTGYGGRRNIVIPFFLAVCLIVLVLILILQAIILYDLRTNSNTATASSMETNDANTGSDINGASSCNNHNISSTVNMDLLYKILNKTQEIVAFNDMHMVYDQNSTDVLEENYNAAQQESSLKLMEIISTLANIKDTTITSEAIINQILMVVEELLKLQNTTDNSCASYLRQPSSCQDVKQADSSSPSGYYHIHSQIMYCNMEQLCGSDQGWTRLGYLDMTDSTVDCPTGFKLYTSGNVRACGRGTNAPGCVHVKIPSNGVSYTEVCGRVIGYQYNSPDGIDTRFVTPEVHNDINQYYVDGVSITQGFPRKHIWTLAAAYSDTYFSVGNCPCALGNIPNQQVQSFVGDNYYCESGHHGSNSANQLYTSDPLWDGEDCGSQEKNCCLAPDLPWFHRTLNSSSTDYIELRVCGDEPPLTNEDTPISFYEIYVK